MTDNNRQHNIIYWTPHGALTITPHCLSTKFISSLNLLSDSSASTWSSSILTADRQENEHEFDMKLLFFLRLKIITKGRSSPRKSPLGARSLYSGLNKLIEGIVSYYTVRRVPESASRKKLGSVSCRACWNFEARQCTRIQGACSVLHLRLVFFLLPRLLHFFVFPSFHDHAFLAQCRRLTVRFHTHTNTHLLRAVIIMCRRGVPQEASKPHWNSESKWKQQQRRQQQLAIRLGENPRTRRERKRKECRKPHRSLTGKQNRQRKRTEDYARLVFLLFFSLIIIITSTIRARCSRGQLPRLVEGILDDAGQEEESHEE